MREVPEAEGGTAKVLEPAVDGLRWAVARSGAVEEREDVRGNARGLNPRTYRSYADALKRLNKATGLTDDTGKPLDYTETHRLRHTRATTLLNSGVPVHVLQRYLGHRSPEMSMRYAQTLDTTARDAARQALQDRLNPVTTS